MHPRTRAIGIALAAFGCLQPAGTLVAQEPATAHAAATGPTMQQTIDFIGKLYDRQGTLHSMETANAQVTYEFNASVTLRSACGLAVKRITRTTDGNPGPSGIAHRFHADTTLIDLSHSDPASIKLVPIATAVPELYEVRVERVSQKPETTVEPVDGSAAAPLSLETDASAAVVLGTVRSAEPDVVLFVTDQGRLMSLSSGTKMKIVLVDRNNNKSLSSFSEIAAGDRLLSRNGTHTVMFLRPAPSLEGVSSFTMPAVSDKESATKLAKAMVHAMVLCHKEDEPSLF